MEGKGHCFKLIIWEYITTYPYLGGSCIEKLLANERFERKPALFILNKKFFYPLSPSVRSSGLYLAFT